MHPGFGKISRRFPDDTQWLGRHGWNGTVAWDEPQAVGRWPLGGRCAACQCQRSQRACAIGKDQGTRAINRESAGHGGCE